MYLSLFGRIGENVSWLDNNNPYLQVRQEIQVEDAFSQPPSQHSCEPYAGSSEDSWGIGNSMYMRCVP